MVTSLWTLNWLVVSLRARALVHYRLYCMRARFFQSWTNICLAPIVMQMTANFICPSAPMLVLINQEVALARMESCIDDNLNWMLNDKLKLNDDKTEFLIIRTSQQFAKVTISSLRVGNLAITHVSSARNLGSWFDAKLTMATHRTRTCNSASYYLYNLRRIRKYLSKENTKTLVHAFISSRIDYCNSLLYGAPEYQINKLQRV